LKSEKWNKNPRNLVGAKCIFDIFLAQIIEREKKKEEKWAS
jgi:hypothetical protein